MHFSRDVFGLGFALVVALGIVKGRFDRGFVFNSIYISHHTLKFREINWTFKLILIQFRCRTFIVYLKDVLATDKKRSANNEKDTKIN